MNHVSFGSSEIDLLARVLCSTESPILPNELGNRWTRLWTANLPPTKGRAPQAIDTERVRRNLLRFHFNRSKQGPKWYRITTGKWVSDPKDDEQDPELRTLALSRDFLNFYRDVYMAGRGYLESRKAEYLKMVRSDDVLPVVGLPTSEGIPSPQAILNSIPSAAGSPREHLLEGAHKRLAIPAAIKTDVWTRDRDYFRSKGLRIVDFDSLCFSCLNPIKSSTFEACHIIPQYQGGPDTIDNIRAGCVDCNRGIGGIHKEHAYEWMFRNRKPGCKYLDPNDPNVIIGMALNSFHEVYEAYHQRSNSVMKIKRSDPIAYRLQNYAEYMRLALQNM